MRGKSYILIEIDITNVALYVRNQNSLVNDERIDYSENLFKYQEQINLPEVIYLYSHSIVL